jgi:hypothetical protein
MFNNFLFENHTVYEIMWKNVVEPDGAQIRAWRLPFASCITKATNTQSEYVIFNGLPLQQWLH